MSNENQSVRQLAAILFADIVGYTSLMQQDESRTLRIIKRYQEILETAASQFNGRVLKNYGDGSLMTFTNSVDAVKSGKLIQEMAQDEPQVPLRIGIHVGEFVFEKGDIYGNGVNLASRIESLGVKGAVLFSDNVYKKIKNHPEFKSADLGSFHFKNVDEPMSVYALSNEGFPVPRREEMQGKLKKGTEEISGNFFQRIWKKKIPQILIAYILIAWIGLQLFDWALLQFGISPHWARLFFITVIGIIPSLLLYLNNKERIDKRQFKLKEKIIFPSNIALLGYLLFFLFKSVDLGATSKTITFINEEGEEETRSIVKEEFVKVIPIFRFDPIKEDSLYDWLSATICVGISCDLSQDKYVTGDDKENKFMTTAEKIEDATLFDSGFYVDGSYEVINGEYKIIPTVRNSKNGKLVAESLFKGDDFFSLMDSISIFVKRSIGMSQSKIDETIDLNLRDITTDNLEAFKYYVESKIRKRYLNLEKAIELDSTFAEALHALSLYRHINSQGVIETKINSAGAMRHRKRLPYQLQMAVLSVDYVVNEEWEKAEKLIKMQLEIAPGNVDFNNFLLFTYLTTGQIDKYIEHSGKLYAQDRNFYNAYLIMMATLMQGKPEKVISSIKPFLLLDPQNTNLLSALVNAYIHNGDYVKAQETAEKIILIDPEAENTMAHIMDVISYLSSHSNANDKLPKFTGTYRNSRGEQKVYESILGNQLYSRPSNLTGNFMFLTSDTSLVHGGPGFTLTKEYLQDENGQFYGTKNQHIFKKSKSDYYYTWKQDSIIWKAEQLLKEKKYALARTAYDKAIKENPEHFYLQQAKDHIDFISTKTDEEIQKIYQKVVGKYGEIRVWVENGKLLLKQDGLGRRILYPVSENSFMTLRSYVLVLDFVEENGKVTAYQEYIYDIKSKKMGIGS